MLTQDQEAALTSSQIDGKLQEVQIPATPPTSNELAKEWSKKYWPMVFRRARVAWQATPIEEAEREEVAERSRLLVAQSDSQKEKILRELPAESIPGFPCAVETHIYIDGFLAGQAHDRRLYGESLFPLHHSPLDALKTLSERVRKLATARNVKRGKSDQQEGEKTVQAGEIKADQYYASNADVYVIGEPCMMCCMALIHSRIARIFIVQRDKSGECAIAIDEQRHANDEDERKGGVSVHDGQMCVVSDASPRSSHFKEKNGPWNAFTKGRMWKNEWVGSIKSTAEVPFIKTLNHHYLPYVVTVCGECKRD